MKYDLLEYLKEKLEDQSRRIESLRDDIVKNAQDLNIIGLTTSTTSLSVANDTIKQLVRDIALYCSVEEVISVKELLAPFVHDLSFTYKYNKAVTLEERELLSETFGYY